LEEFASTTQLLEAQNIRERDGVVSWLYQGNLHSAWSRESEVPPFYFCSATCTPLYTIDWIEDIQHFEYYPNRSDAVIVGSERGVYAVELDGRSVRNIQPIIEAPGLTFRLQSEGTLVVFDGVSYRETRW
jgi:hypothetical protein